MIPLASGAHSVASVVLELLGWVSAAVTRVPGRIGALAAEVRETAAGWGLPVGEVTDLYADFPVRLALAVGAVALVCAMVALVHGLRQRPGAAGTEGDTGRVTES
ncbi:hypothetical protein ACPCUX_10520 [Cellulosimicrobium sp. AB352]|uniref:hypothetical protein n=1 Tax=unclassified Cellulosimicrobium TaxID=2624466 RepID=UPI0004E4154E|nr:MULTISPECIES: hypothetical protein [unclassified Cellulosimicrobium]KFD43384.1 hypothetical protein IU11_11935 [Cellulosimicrobium sp. MM]